MSRLDVVTVLHQLTRMSAATALLAAIFVSRIACFYHVNLFWNPIPDSQVGIEHAYQKRQQENGQEADGYRVYV